MVRIRYSIRDKVTEGMSTYELDDQVWQQVDQHVWRWLSEHIIYGVEDRLRMIDQIKLKIEEKINDNR